MHTPIHEVARKLVQQQEDTTSLLDDCEAFARAHSTTLKTSVITTDESNKLRRYLVVIRKLKAYDKPMMLCNCWWERIGTTGVCYMRKPWRKAQFGPQLPQAVYLSKASLGMPNGSSVQERWLTLCSRLSMAMTSRGLQV